MSLIPRLEHALRGGVDVFEDARARAGGVLVAFTGRRGGVSAAPYDSLNLALRVGDEPDAVDKNRARAAMAAGFDAGRLALARQVHEDSLIEVEPGTAGMVGEADGLVARRPGPVLGILTADCAPVVIAGQRGLAVVHAGWRGVVAGIVERGLDAVGPGRAAWVGPSVRGCCYVVGDEVIDAFRARGLPAGRNRVDPAAASAAILEEAGISTAVADSCTHCHPELFFSYRRDRSTGRQGAFAALLETA